MSQPSLPTTPCHTCRRRRLRCDRSVPVCQKCVRAGRECLGYGRCLIWNQGVASRGKMMGRSYEANRQPQPSTVAVDEQTIDILPGCVPFRSRFDPSGVVPPFEPYQKIAQPIGEVHAAIPQPSLGDTIFDDLPRNMKRYIFHYANYLCRFIMLYDMDSENPMRNLLPVASRHPMLLHIMVATSAYQMFNMCRPNSSSESPGQESPSTTNPRLSSQDITAEMSSNVELMKIYRDALTAKQYALRLLNDALGNLQDSDVDIILASVINFIHLELIESGMHNWRVHVEGAKSLIAFLNKRRGANNSIPRDSNLSHTRTALMSEAIVYIVLGSIFSHSSPAAPLELPSEIEPILAYAETYNYLSCPAELLRILLIAVEIARTTYVKRSKGNDLDMSDIDKMAILLKTAKEFDPLQWASRLQSVTPCPDGDFESRAHIGAAHKAAVRLYLLRLLPPKSRAMLSSREELEIDAKELTLEITNHLASIADTKDAIYKSTVWPTFMAGTETEDPCEIAWITERLHMLWKETRWGYIHNTIKLLQGFWEKKRSQQKETAASFDWATAAPTLGTDLMVA